MADDEIRIKIKALVKSVKEIIESENVNGTIQPEHEIVTRWIVTEFSYDDTGVHFGKSGSQVPVVSWRMAFIKIISVVEESNEYINFSNSLQSIHDIGERGPDYASRFLNRLISNLFTNEKITENEFDEFINRYISELKGQPAKSGTVAQLTGIILRPEEVEISHGIILRKPKKEDFEIDIPVYSLTSHEHFPHPSAFLEISMQAKTQREVDEELKKTITILRLFKPGSVKWITHREYSESITRFFGGTTWTGDNFPALESYLIKDDDVIKLKKFFEKISPIIPPIFYRWDIGREDHISIAYDRYSDALLQGGIIERRIANAIMGLEALYFKPSGEQQELIFRLAIRVAKVLGNLSFDPIQVRRTLKDAYTIRSIFSHGGHLGYNQKIKFNEKYKGDIKNLLNILINFLRVSIIISMTLRSEKDEFIDTIDNALIDQNANQQLINILNPAKNILSITE